MKNIAIIPARSGSKGVRDKNIKMLGEKPLIAYTIEAALKSNVFDTIFVSTDSEKYAAIAKDLGAEVPFLRSPGIATDNASSWDVVREALTCYETEGKTFDALALLQPTSPLRTDRDIVNGFDLMNAKNADCVISVCEVEHSPLWCNTLPEDNSLNGFIRKEYLMAPRQQLPVYYRINGALYIVKTGHFAAGRDLYGPGSFAYVMSQRNSVDIDTELDFTITSALMGIDSCI